MKRVHLIDAKTLGGLHRSPSTENLKPKDIATGSTSPLVAWQPIPNGGPQYLAAVAHSSYALRIHDRHGQLVDVINLTAACTALAWSPTGRTWRSGRAARAGSCFGMLGQRQTRLSKQAAFAGTGKGNLLLYTPGTSKALPIVGKHDRAITAMAWTKNDQLVCISDDKSISISSAEGDAVHVAPLKAQPKHLRLVVMHMDAPKAANGATTKPHLVAVTTLDQGKSLYLHSVTAPAATPPIELAMQPKYGPVIAYAPLVANEIPTKGGKGGGGGPARALAVACAQGYVLVISLLPESLGQEVAGLRAFKSGFTAVAMHPEDASMGLPDLRDIMATLAWEMNETGGKPGGGDLAATSTSAVVDRLVWSPDRRFLTACQGGNVLSFVSSATSLSTSNGDVVATVTGLTEVAVGDSSSHKTHLAIGYNSTSVAIYSLATLTLIKSFTASGPSSLWTCTHIVSLTAPNSPKDPPTSLPRPSLFTAKHPQLLFATYSTQVSIYAPPSTKCMDYAIGHPISQLIASPAAPWIVVDTGSAEGAQFVNVSADQSIPVPKGVGNQFMFDSEIPALFYAWHDDNGGGANGGGGASESLLTTLAYVPHTLTGPPGVVQVCSVRFRPGGSPCRYRAGQLRLLTFSARDGSLIANYYAGETAKVLQGVTKLRPPGLMQLVDAALGCLDLGTAADVLDLIGDTPAAMYLRSCARDVEANVLRGHVLVYLGEVTGAQEMYLASRMPRLALDLRRDLCQWEQALALASKVAPAEEHAVSRAYAASLEADARYADALVMYQRAREGVQPGSSKERECLFGIARMKLRVGDLKAIRMVLEMNDLGLMAECGQILEELREFGEAGGLFEGAGRWERAASNYIKAKNVKKLESIMPKVSSPALLSEYGTLLESINQQDAALAAYTQARDAPNAVRLLLGLSRIDEAVALVRSTRSRDAARLVADFFVRMGDTKAVIEFYVLADMRIEAQQRARDAGILNVYMDLLGSDATTEDWMAAAVYYEQRRDGVKAGEYYMRAGHFEAAVAHLLRSASSDGMSSDQQRAALDLAIECVGKAKSDALTHEVVAHLMSGGTAARDPRTIFRLYMSLGQVREAARTAVVISRDEWAAGNYRPARDVLWETTNELRKNKYHVPAQMRHMLMLLHSYVLVKILIRNDDHLGGARMLTRVSKSISRFPAHVVPILTSTVLECLRVGRKASAAEFAAMLMRPENRSRVDAKYKKKIESLVRKQQEDDKDPPEDQSPCPYCSASLSVTELDCPSCRNTLPFCVASGCHLTSGDWSQCPQCKAPGLLTAMRNIASSKSPECPMCAAPWSVDGLSPVHDTVAALAAWTGDGNAETEPTSQQQGPE
ncbi:hypothetical protein BCR44DRAFT_1430495 [Catenaria anguillulae PL171]|uniref:Uncharacterized protein n=1 Tax=Catenaria anguillulae PL171 TaxID=765915 RepID=A0A1Y2HSM5_9FUNG|nr:hypothetical protein BCR44DRAFT_1430495 [Catenaria anguillulae PL171]